MAALAALFALLWAILLALTFMLFLFGIVLSVLLGTVVLSIKAAFKMALWLIPAFAAGYLLIRHQKKTRGYADTGKIVTACFAIDLLVIFGFVQLPVSASSLLKEEQTVCISLEDSSKNALTYYDSLVQEVFDEINQASIHRKYPVDSDQLYLDPGETILRIRMFDENTHLIQTMHIYENGDVYIVDGDTKEASCYALRSSSDSHVQSVISSLRSRVQSTSS